MSDGDAEDDVDGEDQDEWVDEWLHAAGGDSGTLTGTNQHAYSLFGSANGVDSSDVERSPPRHRQKRDSDEHGRVRGGTAYVERSFERTMLGSSSSVSAVDIHAMAPAERELWEQEQRRNAGFHQLGETE